MEVKLTPAHQYNLENNQNKTGENQADFSTISIHTSKKGLVFLFL